MDVVAAVPRAQGVAEGAWQGPAGAGVGAGGVELEAAGGEGVGLGGDGVRVGRWTFDALNRSTHAYIKHTADDEKLQTRTVYGESLGVTAPDTNHLGQVYRVYDSDEP